MTGEEEFASIMGLLLLLLSLLWARNMGFKLSVDSVVCLGFGDVRRLLAGRGENCDVLA
jgi:hypothetical protein